MILQFFARRRLIDQRVITRGTRLECPPIDRQMAENTPVTYPNVFGIDRPIHLGDDILDTCDVPNTSQAFRLNFEQIDTTVLGRGSEEFAIGTESEQKKDDLGRAANE